MPLARAKNGEIASTWPAYARTNCSPVSFSARLTVMLPALRLVAPSFGALRGVAGSAAELADLLGSSLRDGLCESQASA